MLSDMVSDGHRYDLCPSLTLKCACAGSPDLQVRAVQGCTGTGVHGRVCTRPGMYEAGYMPGRVHTRPSTYKAVPNQDWPCPIKTGRAQSRLVQTGPSTDRS